MLFGTKVKPQSRLFWCAKCEIKTNLTIPRLEALTLTKYSPNIYNIFISLYIYIYTIANYFRYKIQIEVFDATNITIFVIFDRNVEKILNKYARDLTENKLRYNLFKLLNYCKTIDHNIY